MIWPFRKSAPKATSLVRGSTNEAKDSFYVSRPRIEKAISDALKNDENLVIYGPAHQGKTMLLSRQLAARAIYIECRPDFKRSHIYRVLLSSLGYAVLVEKKKKGKGSTTVKLGIAGTGLDLNAEGELEEVMQSVTVDLKNPSEVAHLISRIKDVPRLVLNNFQLLDSGTRRNLLFDLTFFAERASIRTVIVGTWSDEYYLEEIEPAVAGKFTYVLVPSWSDAELRDVVTRWSSVSKVPDCVTPHIAQFLELSAGDVSLFCALMDASRSNGGSAADPEASGSASLLIQNMVLNRFRRGLSTKLRASLAERETYVTYFALEATSNFVNNPEFHPIPNLMAGDYLRTGINPHTNRPYSDGRSVLLDREGNPQYIEQVSSKVVKVQTDILCFLLRRFHAAAEKGSKSIDLTVLVSEFAEQLIPKTIALEEARLKTAFSRFHEVQRQALIVPQMIGANVTGDAMEILDHRLFLFLQSISPEDLEELLDDVQPSSVPSARRRSQVSPPMTFEQKEAYVAQVMAESEGLPLIESPDEGMEDADEGDDA